MSFTFSLLDENSARTILNWRYEPPYDIYDLASSDPEETAHYLLDPQNAFFAIYNSNNHDRQLEAFCSFGLDGQVSGGDYSTPALDIGLGIRPDLTGQGHGSEYINAVIDFANSTYALARLRVTIASFNSRARRAWEKAGFQMEQKFRGGWENMDFIIMMKTMS